MQSETISDDTLTPGQTFTMSATVRNQGTAAATETRVRYFQSDDSVILNSDAEVGSSQVAGLAAARDRWRGQDDGMPADAAVYYYGVCVDSIVGESNVINNCSLAGVAVTVTGGSSDRGVLEAFYNATGGPSWMERTNWLTAAPLSEWFGVTTDREGRVTALNLPGNALSGPI